MDSPNQKATPLPPEDVPYVAEVPITGTYVAQHKEPDGWSDDEVRGAIVGGVTAFVAIALIFLPVQGVQQQTTFSSGLTLLGASAGYVLRGKARK